MRKLVVFDRVTADGYFSGPEGRLDWVVPDAEIDKLGGDAVPGSGNMMLFGRRTYQMFESFWPKALEDPAGASDPHNPGYRSPEMQTIARSINEATKIVFSRTLKAVTWKNSQLRPAFDSREIAALKEQQGKEIMLFGSGEVASQLASHGLIDEYQFMVNPVVLGHGRNLFTAMNARVKLKLVETKAFPSGNVRLRYAAAR